MNASAWPATVSTTDLARRQSRIRRGPTSRSTRATLPSLRSQIRSSAKRIPNVCTAGHCGISRACWGSSRSRRASPRRRDLCVRASITTKPLACWVTGKSSKRSSGSAGIAAGVPSGSAGIAGSVPRFSQRKLGIVRAIRIAAGILLSAAVPAVAQASARVPRLPPDLSLRHNPRNGVFRRLTRVTAWTDDVTAWTDDVTAWTDDVTAWTDDGWSIAGPSGTADTATTTAWPIRTGEGDPAAIAQSPSREPMSTADLKPSSPSRLRSPAVIGATLLLAALVAVTQSSVTTSVLRGGLVLVLVPCALIDLERRIIPNRITGPAAILALALGLALDTGGEPSRLLWAAIAGGFLLIASLINPAGMGMGDVKLLGVMGLFLGRPVIVALMLALIGSVLTGLVIARRHGIRAARKTGLPFGPYLAAAGVVAAIVGDPLLHAYLTLGH